MSASQGQSVPSSRLVSAALAQPYDQAYLVQTGEPCLLSEVTFWHRNVFLGAREQREQDESLVAGA